MSNKKGRHRVKSHGKTMLSKTTNSRNHFRKRTLTVETTAHPKTVPRASQPNRSCNGFPSAPSIITGNRFTKKRADDSTYFQIKKCSVRVVDYIKNGVKTGLAKPIAHNPKQDFSGDCHSASSSSSGKCLSSQSNLPSKYSPVTGGNKLPLDNGPLINDVGESSSLNESLLSEWNDSDNSSDSECSFLGFQDTAVINGGSDRTSSNPEHRSTRSKGSVDIKGISRNAVLGKCRNRVKNIVRRNIEFKRFLRVRKHSSKLSTDVLPKSKLSLLSPGSTITANVPFFEAKLLVSATTNSVTSRSSDRHDNEFLGFSSSKIPTVSLETLFSDNDELNLYRKNISQTSVTKTLDSSIDSERDDQRGKLRHTLRGRSSTSTAITEPSQRVAAKANNARKILRAFNIKKNISPDVSELRRTRTSNSLIYTNDKHVNTVYKRANGFVKEHVSIDTLVATKSLSITKVVQRASSAKRTELKYNSRSKKRKARKVHKKNLV